MIIMIITYNYDTVLLLLKINNDSTELLLKNNDSTVLLLLKKIASYLLLSLLLGSLQQQQQQKGIFLNKKTVSWLLFVFGYKNHYNTNVHDCRFMRNKQQS